MEQKFSFAIKSSTANLAKISQFIEKILHQLNINKEIHDDIIISVDEVATNIIIHAYHNDQTKTIKIIVLVTDKKIQIDLYHTGDTFDPESVPQPVLSPHLVDRKKGGLGLYIVNTFMDEIQYVFKTENQKENIISLTKYLQGGKIGTKSKET